MTFIDSLKFITLALFFVAALAFSAACLYVTIKLLAIALHWTWVHAW